MRARFILLAVVALPAAANAATFRVPSDYSTIQLALTQCSVGDTVLVAPGVYDDYILVDGITGTVAFLPDGVILISEAGPDATVIDLSSVPGSEAFGVYSAYHTSGQTQVSGFKFLMHRPACRGILVDTCSHVEIRDCIFEVDDPIDPDTSTYRGGITSVVADVRVTDCTFLRCMASVGAGIVHNSGPLVVEDCTFIECQNQGIRAIGGLGAGPHSLEVRDCVFQRISSVSTGGCVSTRDLIDGVTVDACRFDSPAIVGARGAALGLGGSGVKVVTGNSFYDMTLSAGASCVSIEYGAASVRGNTFAYLEQTLSNGVALYAYGVGNIVFENNIVAHTAGVRALYFENSAPVSGSCNVFWDNDPEIGYPLHVGDRIADPLFCDEDARDLTLHESSPCLPANSLGCGLIGALGQGCGMISVEAQSWGKTKSLYRGEKE